jgi:hypothetical protein
MFSIVLQLNALPRALNLIMIKMIESRRMRWMGHEAHTTKTGEKYRISAKNMKVKEYFGDVGVYVREILKCTLEQLRVKWRTGFN